MQPKKSAAHRLKELRAQREPWNMACSYGAHSWVCGEREMTKVCQACGGVYFCTPGEWAGMVYRQRKVEGDEG